MDVQAAGVIAMRNLLSQPRTMRDIVMMEASAYETLRYPGRLAPSPIAPCMYAHVHRLMCMARAWHVYGMYTGPLDASSRAPSVASSLR